MKIFCIGAGTWATALANVLCDNGHEVMMYSRDGQQVADINQLHINRKYFPDVVLSETLQATADLERADEYDIILLSVPSSVCCLMAEKLNSILTHPVVIINTAKGFNPDTFERLSVEIRKIMKPELLKDYFALLGPSHAEEVILRMETAVNIAGNEGELISQLQEMFSNDYFRVYRNYDLTGCEYGAGLKNIIAIASGIIYGLGLGDNAKASLMTRGISEISRYGMAMGGRQETFMGLCGIGDLIVTCTSVHSRNWQAGYQIGKDNTAENFWKENTKTVEGVNACKIVYQKARQLNIPMPITEQVYEVLFNGKKPIDAARDLMHRQLKKEIY